MQRLIRSFNTLTDELKAILQEQYPDGIDSTHIKTIPTAKGEMLRVIELRTPEALYLIKINAESRAEIEEFLEQDNEPAGDDENGMDEEGMEEGGGLGDEEDEEDAGMDEEDEEDRDEGDEDDAEEEDEE